MHSLLAISSVPIKIPEIPLKSAGASLTHKKQASLCDPPEAKAKDDYLLISSSILRNSKIALKIRSKTAATFLIAFWKASMKVFL